MAEKMPKFHSAHFIGIGGAGMSGIALVLHERGCKVTGSDLKASRYVRELENAGIHVYVGHHADTIDKENPDVVVVSSAIPETNPELVHARQLSIPVWRRAQMLSALSDGAKTIAVAGTHGKTTTSSMIATMLDKIGMDPSFLIGGIVEDYDTNGKNGNGGYFVCEADESDGSFLYLHPNICVITNIEADHLDHYGTLANIEKTFCEFMNLVGDAGTIIIFGDIQHLVDLAHSTGRRVMTYGFKDTNDYVCIPQDSHHQLESHFIVKTPGGKSEHISLHANPGCHNMLNATAAMAVADVIGADLDKAATALSAFKGVRRRFTHVGDIDGVTVIDDYGHHPTEIKATLSAAADLEFKRIIVVFQPHRYSRTQALKDLFAQAFDKADTLLVMDVFSAGEMPIPGISGKTVATEVQEHGDVDQVEYIPNRKKLIARLVEIVKPGDMVITQGAGDVTAMGPAFIKAMKERDEAKNEPKTD